MNVSLVTPLNASKIYDVAIVGGGIVGLATARELSLRHPKLKMCVLEKQKELALHQSDRNSGVVHAGIYYKPKTLKSKFCVQGSRMVMEYCSKVNIPMTKCGKLIVASKSSNNSDYNNLDTYAIENINAKKVSNYPKNDIEVLHELYKNAQKAGIKDLQLLTKRQIEKIQEGCTSATEAIWSPNTAIVNWRQVALKYGDEFVSNDGHIHTDFRVNSISPCTDHKTIHLTNKLDKYIQTRCLIICAGLQTNAVARELGFQVYPRIIPFKGRYYKLSERIASSIKTNVYPVPNPKLPFLGVHITPRLDNSVIVGPTAILTTSYESYMPDSDLRLFDSLGILFSKGLRNMMKHRDYRRAGVKEFLKNHSKELVAFEVRKLIPDVQSIDLIDENFYGIRAQAVSEDGLLVDDFIIESSARPELKNLILVRNCPSPAATSSMAIAERLADMVENSYL